MRLPLITWLLWCLSTGAGLAQGTIRFDWNGNQNQVHGGFDVTWQEFYGYTTWGSPVLLNSITFTDFYGVVMSSSLDFCRVWGTNDWQGWSFAIDLLDSNRGVVLHARGTQGMTVNYIAETDLGGTPFGWENGTWNSYWVPEPDATALLGFGLVCLLVRKWRGAPS